MMGENNEKFLVIVKIFPANISTSYSCLHGTGHSFVNILFIIF